MRKLAILLLILGVCVLTGAGLGSAAVVNVSVMDSLTFSPADVTINVGDTVRWTNQGFNVHTVTSGDNCVPDGLWNSGNLNYLGSFERVFDQAGVFPYHCATPGHCPSGMRGTVTVVAAPPPASITFVPYSAAEAPKVSPDVSLARPMGTGSVADGGDTFDIRLGFPAFSAPMDIYFAIAAPVPLGTNEIFVLGPDSLFLPASTAGIVPWIEDTFGPVDTSLFGTIIPVSALPPGTYTLLAVLTEANAGLGSMALWHTTFVIGDEVVITVALSGSEEFPNPVATNGSGTGTIVVNVGSGEIVGRATFSGLSSNTLFAHIHQGAAGANGPVIIPLEGGEGVTQGEFRVPAGTVLTAEQLTALMSNGLYFNVHTETNTGGELRGQILYPTDPLSAVSALNGDRQLPNAIETAGSGRGVLTLDQATGGLSAYVTFTGLSANTLFAHIHEQNAGSSTGPVLIPLEGGEGVTAGVFTTAAGAVLAQDKAAALTGGTLYFNIHTETNTGGEIRGQIAP